jgi:hypothetical protein
VTFSTPVLRAATSLTPLTAAQAVALSFYTAPRRSSAEAATSSSGRPRGGCAVAERPHAGQNAPAGGAADDQAAGERAARPSFEVGVSADGLGPGPVAEALRQLEHSSHDAFRAILRARTDPGFAASAERLARAAASGSRDEVLHAVEGHTQRIARVLAGIGTSRTPDLIPAPTAAVLLTGASRWVGSRGRWRLRRSAVRAWPTAPGA